MRKQKIRKKRKEKERKRKRKRKGKEKRREGKLRILPYLDPAGPTAFIYGQYWHCCIAEGNPHWHWLRGCQGSPEDNLIQGTVEHHWARLLVRLQQAPMGSPLPRFETQMECLILGENR